MKKGRTAVSLVLNILILGALGFAFVNRFVGFLGTFPEFQPLPFFVELPIVSSIVLAIAALLMVIVDIAGLAGKKGCAFVSGTKLAATALSLLSVILVVGYLTPKSGNWASLVDYKFELFVYVVAPALALISLFFEPQPKLRWVVAFAGMCLATVYGGAVIALVTTGVIADNLYGVTNFAAQEWWMSLIVGAIVVVGGFLVTYLLWALRKLAGKGIADEEAPAAEEAAQENAEAPAEEAAEAPAEQEKPAEEEKAEEPAPAPVVESDKQYEPAAKPEPVKEEPKPAPRKTTAIRRPVARKAPAAKSASSFKGGARVYHISKHPSGEWQVKLASSEKAIKLLPTQAEAIAYAKGLVESRGGSVRIHSVKGKMRKE